MDFAQELEKALPADLPNRDVVVAKCARHLELIVEANQVMNLTRIVDPREAAIKHVLDSVLPWRLFVESRSVLDAGTGAGLPGIPLSIVLPEVRWTLSESIQKKARFVAGAVEALGLKNVKVTPSRAEESLREHRADVVTARAVAPLSRAAPLFAAAIRSGTRLLLYKGPDVEAEIAEAAGELRAAKMKALVVFRYELPEGLGARSIVEVSRYPLPT